MDSLMCQELPFRKFNMQKIANEVQHLDAGDYSGMIDTSAAGLFHHHHQSVGGAVYGARAVTFAMCVFHEQAITGVENDGRAITCPTLNGSG